MIAVVDSQLAWFVSRSAGLVCWLLCAASIVWGLAVSTRLVRRRGLPAWLLDLHTYLGTLAVVFCLIHMGALVADNFTYFSWKELLVPMGTKWNPGAVAWGIAAFYLLLAVQLTSWFRSRLPRKVWHSIHLSSFGLFIAGTVHGIEAGTDWTNVVVRAGAATVCVLVVWWTAMRLMRQRWRRTVTHAFAPRPITCDTPTRVRGT